MFTESKDRICFISARQTIVSQTLKFCPMKQLHSLLTKCILSKSTVSSWGTNAMSINLMCEIVAYNFDSSGNFFNINLGNICLHVLSPSVDQHKKGTSLFSRNTFEMS